jgi:EAL and modified HD-GYP domain-containing signal transduction protein
MPMKERMEAPSVLVARQPICDRHRHCVGYELLFRAHDREAARVVDDEQATAHVLVTAFADIGVRQLVGSHFAAINVSRRFLLDVDPLPFGPKKMVLELLEDQEVDARLLSRLQELRASGYTFALDDFRWTPTAAPLIELANMIKLDVLSLGQAGTEQELARLRDFRGRLVAEKVETEAEFERCLQLGFDLFQGYFFCRPELVAGRPLSTGSLRALHTAAELASEDVTFEQLETIVSRDPGLTVRLLRLLNSAAFSLNRKITTVREAMIMLGERNVRQWTLLILLAGLPTSADELLPTALVRARLLEQLADQRGDRQPAGAFVVGLFSVVDALLGTPMEEVLDGVPLADEHAAALLRHEGANGRALRAVIAHERGEAWDPELAGTGAAGFGAAYVEAVGWARNALPDPA